MGDNLLVLANSSLELGPEEFWKGKQVISSANKKNKKPGQILLDVSLHGWDMNALKDRESRGRPDIVHQCLIEAMDSPAYLDGYLDVIVELRNAAGLLHFKRGVRLPRNYDQFKGLMEQVLTNGRAPLDNEPLIWVEKVNLNAFLNENGYSVYVLEQGGKSFSAISFPSGKLAFVVGAFQKGKIPSETLRLGPKVSLYDGRLTANAAVSLIACLIFLKTKSSIKID